MTLIYLSLAWIVGILAGSLINLPIWLLPVGLAPLFFLLFNSRHRKAIILSGLCILVLASGAVYFRSSQPAVNEKTVQFYNGSVTELKGTISGEPELSNNLLHLKLSVHDARVNGEWTKISGTVLLFVPSYPSFKYGDSIQVKGRLEAPPRFEGFDYASYLAQQDIYSTMTYPRLELLSSGNGFKPLGWLYSTRENLSKALARIVPEPQASLAQGIVLGIRANIPPEIEQQFINTGTAHILAVSEMNLSVMAGILLSFGVWLFGKKRYLYVWLALTGVWLYAVLTGMNPPVLRAAIMASIFLGAELSGRQRSGAVALFLAAAIMVGVTPQALWSASFQLSFLSFAGLIFIAPPIQSWGRNLVLKTLGEEGFKTSAANFMVDSLSVSLGAIIAVWPIIAYYFGVISWAGLPATMLIIPVLLAIILLGFVGGGLALVMLPLGQLLGWVLWLPLAYMLLAVRIFDTASPLNVSIDSRLVWGYYAVLTLIILITANMNTVKTMASKFAGLSLRTRKWSVPALTALAVLIIIVTAGMPDSRVQLSFLDVGQGDAILIQQGNQQVLVDGGPSPRTINTALGKKMAFWDRNIDLLVSTHPHADHLTGLVEVMNRYHVDRVLDPELPYKSPINDEWQTLIAQKKVEKIRPQSGEQVKMGSATIEILSPGLSQNSTSDIDPQGLVLRVSVGEISFLLTADINSESEIELITDRAALSCTVLKVAHHGSSTSSSDEFLSVVRPTLAVIQVGKDNDYGHPAGEALNRLKNNVGQQNIYRTDQRGTVEVITDGKRLWVKTDR